ncbi:carboxylesterase 12 [Pyrus ussuriensis x Pyrus communis]|uniref:Carboxylesterase 12 n=1 Tax=Pyrus ussuriensis x Pyrus communis TaxID=2448454 RepID=A0A5N5IL43_9ROSA|nr:carboxylesterase 12 [Pyrus ussuriensis x Pyrus communis]
MSAISILVLIVLFSFVMLSMNDEVAYDFFPFMRIYKNGTIERFMGKQKVPSSLDPKIGVQSKDMISHKENIFHKVPFLVYFHGGGFCVEIAFSPLYHNHINSLVAMANVVDVSVEYKLALKHPLPIAYEDSWIALKWVASYFDGKHSEEWLKRCRSNAWTKLTRAKLKMPPILRLFMVGLLRFMYPLSSGIDDLLFNPVKDPKLRNLGCQKVLVFVTEKDALYDRGDALYDRGRNYSMALRRSVGRKGVVKVWKTEEENHVFHLFQPTNEKAVAMMKMIVLFFN